MENIVIEIEILAIQDEEGKVTSINVSQAKEFVKTTTFVEIEHYIEELIKDFRQKHNGIEVKVIKTITRSKITDKGIVYIGL